MKTDFGSWILDFRLDDLHKRLSLCMQSIIKNRKSEMCAVAITALLAFGCQSNGPTTQPASMSERQDQAMKDPFSYGPAEHDGKGAKEVKKRDESLKGDWERFWNP